MPHNPLTVHMIVKNDDRFVWYAIMSVIDFADKLLITDTGSEDSTANIISSIKSDKISFTKRKIRDVEELAALRDEHIRETKSDWFWIVDGDEIYPRSVCSEIQTIIKDEGKNLEGIVVGRYDLLGDIYHYQEESVGSYNLFGRNGHIVLRLINKKNIPGLHIEGTYPYEGYYDKNNAEIIHHSPEKFRFTRSRILHAMYLKRSTSGANLRSTFHRKKWKIEFGNTMPADYEYPQHIFFGRPAGVPDITGKRSRAYSAAAAFLTPIKKMKRKIAKHL